MNKLMKNWITYWTNWKDYLWSMD